VRNGNRWRVAGIDTATNRLAAERLSDGARTVFDGDYLTEHITLGYATTVHAAQGVATDTCHALLSEGASRAMAYVAMTRGRHTNHAYLYQKLNHEADHHHATPIAAPQIHQLHRGTKYTAAQAFRALLANDNRPTTCMHKPNTRQPSYSQVSSQRRFSATSSAAAHAGRSGRSTSEPSMPGPLDTNAWLPRSRARQTSSSTREDWSSDG
jgi:hypothetical protein